MGREPPPLGSQKHTLLCAHTNTHTHNPVRDPPAIFTNCQKESGEVYTEGDQQLSQRLWAAVAPEDSSTRSSFLQLALGEDILEKFIDRPRNGS